MDTRIRVLGAVALLSLGMLVSCASNITGTATAAGGSVASATTQPVATSSVPTTSAVAPTTTTTTTTATTTAARPQGTTVVTYQPWSGTHLAAGIASSKSIVGYCWESSAATARSDAFRCMSGNFIYDPCFVGPASSSVAACPDNNPSTVTVMQLNQPLPQANPPTNSTSVWMLLLTGGDGCFAITGAGDEVDGMESSYGCPDGLVYGSPSRATATWTVHFEPDNGHTLTTKTVAAAYR